MCDMISIPRATMFKFLCLVSLAIAAVAGLPDSRIMGGAETTIDKFPYAVVLLSSNDGVHFVQTCGGSIINNRSILTAASCFDGATKQWQARVGSSFANSGGSVHQISQIFINPSYYFVERDNDIAVIHVSTAFVYGNNVQATAIGGAGYTLEDDVPVTAIGWGETEYAGPGSEQLRSVDIWTVNFETCRSNYNVVSIRVTENMMCAGYIGVGGRDVCSLDYGGPLLHNDVIVGVASLGFACGYANYPGLYARVGQHADWIVSVA